MPFLRSWLEKFVQEIESELCLEIESQKNRFSSYDNLLKKFRRSAELFGEKIKLYETAEKDSRELWKLEKELWKLWMKFVEEHNEICVAYEILKLPCIELEYEPKTYHTEKRIDFHAIFSSQESKWIEVKTIHPDDVTARVQIKEKTETREELDKAKLKETNKIEQKDWNQYQESRQYFPHRTGLTIFRDGDGAEIWHDKIAARGRMLEYSLEFEKRINKSSIGANEICILAFVGNGYDWRLDELEDFVTFYHTGKHLLASFIFPARFGSRSEILILLFVLLIGGEFHGYCKGYGSKSSPGWGIEPTEPADLNEVFPEDPPPLLLGGSADPAQAREAFYALAGPAISAGKIVADKVNKLVKLGDYIEVHAQLCAALG